MKLVTVYGLCSSEDGRIRYVGQTNQKLAYRLQAHIGHAKARRSRAHSGWWIRKVLDSGYEVRIFPIEENAVRNDAERRLIAWYREQGARLTNISPGGDGELGRRSVEHRKAISEALRGKPKSKEHKQKLSAALKGKPLPPNLLAACRAGRNRKPGVLPTFAGRTHSAETKAKMAAAQRGHPVSDDARQRMREASARRWTAEARAAAADKTRAFYASNPE